MCGLGVWRSRSFAPSWWFFLQSVSPASLQDFTLGSTLSKNVKKKRKKCKINHSDFKMKKKKGSTLSASSL
jgi:hypothetical protein